MKVIDGIFARASLLTMLTCNVFSRCFITQRFLKANGYYSRNPAGIIVLNRKYHLSLSGAGALDNNMTDTKGSRGLGMCDFDCNILHADLRAEKERYIAAAVEAGVQWFVCPGSQLRDSRDLLELAATDSRFLATAGVHPYNAETEPLSDTSLQLLDEMVSAAYCRAVGECGLDYSAGFPDKEKQIPWFRAQIELALRLKKPLYLHSRAAQEDFVSTLNSLGFGSSPGSSPPVAGCVHCFTGTTEELLVYLNMGFYIGLTGFVVTMDKAVLAQWLDMITLDKLVIETDAPYMGFKGARKSEPKGKDKKYPNVPAALPLVLDAVCEASGWPRQQVIERTTRNALVNILGVSDIEI
jgi:TatD DNase family protein